MSIAFHQPSPDDFAWAHVDSVDDATPSTTEDFSDLLPCEWGPLTGVRLHRQGERFHVYAGDSLDVLRTFGDATFDAIVTDPPYGLEFMGKEWDAPWKGDVRQIGDPTFKQGESRHGKVRHGMSRSYGGDPETQLRAFQAWCEEWATECLRVLKPGGHLLAFGGARTWHRLATGIEDAGFELRDSIAWLYGSGFPKSLDVSKAIDKAAGATREVVSEGAPVKRMIPGADQNKTGSWIKDSSREFIPQETAPATEDAARWEGWGTALKPAFEPIVVARKPFKGTVAANVLAHGTGALNIDACRIETDDDLNGGAYAEVGNRSESASMHGGTGMNVPGKTVGKKFEQPTGRWPANVVLDEDTAAELDEQVGVLKSGANPTRRGSDKSRDTYGEFTGQTECTPARGADAGGPSRFFYVAKASAKERPKVDGVAHPTVKPLALMQWLLRLVTPPDGLVLDPFAGSGTTIEAALREGFGVVGIEREESYLPLIEVRIQRTLS
jgi:site-specific DNA-methyltransferase (adenine-specific)